MSRLEELIQKLCPDGVEYCQLSTLADISTGSHNTNEELDDGAYPFFVRSQDVRRLNTYDYDETAIITSGDGVGVGKIFHYISGKYALHQRAYRIHIIDDRIMSEFFFHYMKATFFEYIQKTAVNSSVTSVRRPMLNKYPVPVPPLEVQREIVQILDNFTSLIAELQAELQARKKQYEYYRDSLLSKYESVSMKSIESLCKVSAGGDAPKDAMSKSKTVEYKFPIISNGVGENALYGYTNQAKIMEPAVTVAARGTIGYAEYRDYPYFPIIRLLSLIPNDTEELDTKFLYYCLQGKKYNVPTTGIPQLTAPMLKQVEIPLPNISVQRKIVGVLDNFEQICNDLNIGLPAEIEARQKQYEYYRDALLSFDNSYFVNVEREREREREMSGTAD